MMERKNIRKKNQAHSSYCVEIPITSNFLMKGKKIYP